FCCTSEDINNLSYSLMMQDSRNQVLSKSLDGLIVKMRTMSEQYHNFSMLYIILLYKGRTHGQPESLTMVG
ncbi:MAG: adenylosuccinate lyase, partial [bacterium]